ncbi:MAG: ABC transporter permease [Bacteroidales bacterium]|nr:ABC transporter permease [Bacteroidales bacterium]
MRLKKISIGSVLEQLRNNLKSLANNSILTENNYVSTKALGVIVRKEVADYIRSWRFLIMVFLIVLTCIGSVYTAISNMAKAVEKTHPDQLFFFLKLFTVSDGTMPSFIVFIGFLGPLLGLMLGFDAINHEQNRGTLSRLLSQPIPRDYVLNAKFLAAYFVVSALLLSLGLMVIGAGMIVLGVLPSAEEFIRILTFLVIATIYIAVWINLAIFFSVRFRQPATSALAGLAVWLFFTVFYPLILSFILKPIEPSEMASAAEIIKFEKVRLLLVQFMPNELFSQATTTLLTPSIRSIGPLTIQQVYGSIPAPLPFLQSLLIVLPQIIGLFALTLLCFVLSYISFMRKEVRSR